MVWKPLKKERRSAVFAAVAAGKAAGASVFDDVLGRGVQRATVLRWAAAGFVTIRYGKRRKDDHHRERRIVDVRLTKSGVRFAGESSPSSSPSPEEAAAPTSSAAPA